MDIVNGFGGGTLVLQVRTAQLECKEFVYNHHHHHHSF